jgi:hypothetical protein
MTPRWINLYHVTTYATAGKILDSHGIDPKFTQGRKAVIWYVTKKMVPWAIAHVMHRHNIEIDKVVILSIKGEYADLQRTSKTGVYCTKSIYYPHSMDSASMWLSREEKYIHVPGGRTNRWRWLGKSGQEAEDVPEL